MAIITQKYDIDLKATGWYPIVEMSQFDTGSRTVVLTVYDGENRVPLDGCVARVDGRRSDGVEFTESCTIGANSTVSFVVSQEMTREAGKHVAELVIIDAAGNTVGTENFIIDVEPASMFRDAAASADDRTLYDQYTGSIEQKFSSLSKSLTGTLTEKTDALTKTVQDIDALLGGSSKARTIINQNVTLTLSGRQNECNVTLTYDPISGLVVLNVSSQSGIVGVPAGSHDVPVLTIPTEYLPSDDKYIGSDESDVRRYVCAYDGLVTDGTTSDWGVAYCLKENGQLFLRFEMVGSTDSNYEIGCSASWYARGGRYLGVTPIPTGSNTVTVGTTTTGEPGTQASVVNSGTAKDVVLDFTIPRGADGTGGGSGYTLPAATSSTLGGVKIGSGISVTSDGTISASSGGGSLSMEQYNLSDWSVTADGVKIGDDISKEEVPVGNPSLLFYKYGERLYAETMYFYLRTTGTVVNGQVCSFTYIRSGVVVDYSASEQNPLVGVAIFEEDGKDGVGTPLAPGYVTLIFEPRDEGSPGWGKVAVWLASPELKPNTNYLVSFSISGLIHAAETND